MISKIKAKLFITMMIIIVVVIVTMNRKNQTNNNLQGDKLGWLIVKLIKDWFSCHIGAV